MVRLGDGGDEDGDEVGTRLFPRTICAREGNPRESEFDGSGTSGWLWGTREGIHAVQREGAIRLVFTIFEHFPSLPTVRQVRKKFKLRLESG